MIVFNLVYGAFELIENGILVVLVSFFSIVSDSVSD